MRAIINIGGTGAGKTHETKKILSKSSLPKFVNDINHEYNDNEAKRYFGLTKNYVDLMTKEGRKGHRLFVIEEAVNVFDNKGRGQDSEILEQISTKRHKNLMYVLNYHAFSQLPLWLLIYIDFINVKPTNERKDVVTSRFKGTALYEAYLLCEKAKEKGFTKTTITVDRFKNQIVRKNFF
jgi:hypothetical protein